MIETLFFDDLEGYNSKTYIKTHEAIEKIRLSSSGFSAATITFGDGQIYKIFSDRKSSELIFKHPISICKIIVENMEEKEQDIYILMEKKGEKEL